MEYKRPQVFKTCWDGLKIYTVRQMYKRTQNCLLHPYLAEKNLALKRDVFSKLWHYTCLKSHDRQISRCIKHSVMERRLQTAFRVLRKYSAARSVKRAMHNRAEEYRVFKLATKAMRVLVAGQIRFARDSLEQLQKKRERQLFITQSDFNSRSSQYERHHQEPSRKGLAEGSIERGSCPFATRRRGARIRKTCRFP